MPSNPKFSIVIPTRNRASTLASTLRTCVELDHPSFEVVITDNDSTDNTADIVAAFGDELIRYTKTPTYLNMARNFENGLRHARGEFLIFIGSDDGILPFALRALEAVFAKHPDVDAIDWSLNPFFWPHAPTARLTLNWLSNLTGPAFETAEQAWKRINSPRSHDYNELNGFNIYHGCVRRSVFEAASAAGVSLFDGPIPDVTSAIRILRFARRKLRLDVALTINGTSRLSTGWAALAPRRTPEQLKILSEFYSTLEHDFPNAALAQYINNRGYAFLRPLIDERLDIHGNLEGLDVKAWRRILIEIVVRLPQPEAERRRIELNEILVWVHERGAPREQPVSEEDIESYRKNNDWLPRLFLQPFRFSDAALSAAKGRRKPAYPAPAGGIQILSIEQRKDDILLVARSHGVEFTIHDYVQLMISLMNYAPLDAAQLLVEDPAALRELAIQRVLDQFATAV